MKKLLILILILLVIAGAFIGWKMMGPAVSTSNGEFVYVRTGSTYADVRRELINKKYLNSPAWFDLTSKLLKYKTIKPGRYKVKKGMSLLNLVRMLRNGNQSPVNFAITKFRTKEDFARRAGNLFEPDSLQLIALLNNNDSLKKYGLDTNTVMAALMPYTYTLNWNTTPPKLFQKIYTAYREFWTPARKQKADSLGLTPIEVSTLASIIDEETNKKQDKPLIASVYRNRIKKGMLLQADPTVKFAMKDFGLKVITFAHLKTNSPYNTYMYKGLPPGPICTPAVETIEAVLDSPETDYLYFVANSNFDGTHIFTKDYADHMKYAKEYQAARNKLLDSLQKANPQ